MKNKEVINRIFNNLGYSYTDRDKLTEVRYDLHDTLVDVFNLSEAPRKKLIVPVDTTKEISEGFEDDTLEDNISLSGGTITVGTWRLLTGGEGTLTFATESIDKIKFSVLTAIAALPVTDQELTITVSDQEGNELWSDTFTVSDGGDTDYESSSLGYSTPINGLYIVKVETGEIDLTWSYISLSSITFTVYQNEYTLPEEVFIPLEAEFKSGDRVYPSTEMSPERFNRWNPNYIVESEGDVETWNNQPDLLHSTSENIDYDGSIGYYLNVNEAGRWVITWKKSVDCQIVLWYSYFPSINTSDSQSLQVHKAYLDVIVYGATIRGILRQLSKAKDLTEIQLASLRTSYSIYNDKYKKKVTDITGFFQRTAETAQIIPFSFLNDPNMELD